eukprot:gnl/TRDRNA2_/TRDRNA2_157956_c0_seq1.p1 gnl/TRDRNA2_/TRDRNA2_157956_c0~~gnl/TRDRNA2_/TRDRNA2_157956_c0_seq1.p1  ORF type:complete len:402 (-),score=54.04 gnl/TRDRNA2_/TRDRNA2_157956_c0_seq1:151-1356(-)
MDTSLLCEGSHHSKPRRTAFPVRVAAVVVGSCLACAACIAWLPLLTTAEPSATLMLPTARLPNLRSRLFVGSPTVSLPRNQFESAHGSLAGSLNSQVPAVRSLPAPRASTIQTEPSSLESVKASLLRIALLGGRGAWSRPSEREKAASLVEELERSAEATPTLRDGVWELVVSDVEPFRASVFFLALAEAVEAILIKDASDGALTVHSMATGGGEVGRVAHVIENNSSRLHSLVELKTGSVPSLPLALTGVVISSGELSKATDGDDMFSLVLKNTTVQESKVKYGLPSEDGLKAFVEPNALSWIGDQFVPSGDIFSSVLDPLGGGQTALLKLSYADDEMMVWRTPRLGNHFFCFVRGDAESWPAMDELKARQSTQQQSLVGSGFALGMLNAFWRRRAAVQT